MGPLIIDAVNTRRAPQDAGNFDVILGDKLRKLRESRGKSPEDVADRVIELGGQISASYLRRLEKGTHSVTVQLLSHLLRALDSNLALFFEEELEGTLDPNDKNRRYRRILQRGLDSEFRDDVIGVVKVLERALGPRAS